MSDRESIIKRLSEDEHIGSITKLPEFDGWVTENPVRLESIVKAVPYPYSSECTAPEVARLEAATAAIIMIKQRLGDDGDLRAWLDKMIESNVDFNSRSKQLSTVKTDGLPASLHWSLKALNDLYVARDNYQEAIESLSGVQKTMAEQALKQLNKAIQPKLDEYVKDIIEGFASVRADQERGLEIPDLPDSVRRDLETARDLCDLATMHLKNRSLTLANSVQVGS